MNISIFSRMLNLIEAMNAGRLALFSIASVIGGSLAVIFKPIAVGFTLLYYYFNLFLVEIGLPEITLPDISVDTMLQRGAWTVAIVAGLLSAMATILKLIKTYKDLFPRCNTEIKPKIEDDDN